mmetsp:Transcript_59314/g.127463  ORF Transcript_59314/g.127463 Transcript_59314/m.127463 type:complete len:415 (+) Transcript_59314:80-1324(+)
MMVSLPLSLAVWSVAFAPCVALADTDSPDCADDSCVIPDTSLLQTRLGFGAGSLMPRSRTLPSLQVDLDEAPESRWNSVVKYYLDTGLIQADEASEAASEEKPHLQPSDEKKWIDAIKLEISDEVMREAAGMAAYVNSYDPAINISVDHILSAQYGYEQNYPEYCSGLIAAMPNGTVIHGRNMDYPGSWTWKNQTIGWPEKTTEVTFIRGGLPLYTSLHWPLQLGIHTAMRFGGWSFEQNTRRLGNDMQNDLSALQQGGHGFCLFARRVMEQVPDFETALQTLWTTKWAAPQYFIMTGAKPWEGAVLSLDRLGAHEASSPSPVRLSQNESRWHLVQTNDDRNAFSSDPRRPMANAYLATSGQSQVSTEWMLDQMSRPPLFNFFTAFTWIAIPATDYHQTTLPPGTIDVATFSAQ